MFKFNKFIKTEHFLMLLLCLVYFSVATSLSHLTSKEIFDYIKFYFSIYIPYLFPFIFIFWAVKSIKFLLENKNEGFLGLEKCWKEQRNDYLSRDSFLRFFMIFPLIPFFNFSYSSIKQTIPIQKGQTFDLSLKNIDFFLHGGKNPWELLQPLFGYPPLTRALDFLYLFWGSLFLFTLLWMAFSKRRHLRMQFFFTLMLCWILIGNLLARLLASAGPCYYSKVVSGVSDPYLSMMNFLRSTPELKAVIIQDALWQSHTEGIFMPLGGISAMPSMHVSIAVLLALVYSRINRTLGTLFVLYAGMIQIGSVHLGWHYAIDGYFSIILTIIIWKGVGRIATLLNEKQQIFPPRASAASS